MNTEQHPLLQLPPEKQQALVDIVTDDEVDELAGRLNMERRDVLKVLAMLGGGAAVGGFTLSELTGAVRAAADTSDEDGNVGLPGDRVDVFAEGIDSNSVSTAVVDITTAGGFSRDAIDPAETTVNADGRVTVSGNSYHTIFDVASGQSILTGVVSGPLITPLRVTFDGGTIHRLGSQSFNAGQDTNGDDIGSAPVPPLRDVTKLEFKNTSGASQNFGYQVIRR